MTKAKASKLKAKDPRASTTPTAPAGKLSLVRSTKTSAKAAAPKTAAKPMHPTVKPVAMVADAILDVSRHNDIVLDPFSGSGTTILAAERTGRRGYGIELDPLYVDLTIARWQKMAGQTATHACGKSFAEIRAERRVEDDEA